MTMTDPSQSARLREIYNLVGHASIYLAEGETGHVKTALIEILERVDAALAAQPQAEPVAWLAENKDGTFDAYKEVHALIDDCRQGFPVYRATHPAPQAEPSSATVPSDEQMDKVRDAVAGALGDAYDCLRVWSAWGVGTMRSGDFSLVAEDSERVNEIANAAVLALAAPEPSGPLVEGWQLSVANGHSGYGVYAHMTEYPEEGAQLLLALAAPAVPDPMKEAGKEWGKANGEWVKRHRDAAQSADAVDALRELLETSLAPFPSEDKGKEAQDAWADRRAAARKNAAFVLSAAAAKEGT
jgi:hypothetical protein